MTSGNCCHGLVNISEFTRDNSAELVHEAFLRAERGDRLTVSITPETICGVPRHLKRDAKLIYFVIIVDNPGGI